MGARVGRHDQDHIAEVHLLAVIIGQLAVIHDLQEDIEQIRMRLLDFIEQQDRMRLLVNGIGQQTALIKTDITRRRADQATDRMPFHIFRHIKAHQIKSHYGRQLAGNLGLADAGRPGEKIRANRLFRFAQSCTGEFDRTCQRINGLILSEDDTPQVNIELAQVDCVFLRYGFRRNARNLGHHSLNVLDADGFLALAFRFQHLCRTDLVDHVDCLVRQFTIINVARR